MDPRAILKTFLGVLVAIGSLFLLLFIISGFGNRQSIALSSIQQQIMHIENGTEPSDLDPQLTTGVQEDNIIRALIEGLVAEDPVDLHPIPGQAERWEISDDGKVYTFYIRDDAFWSNGDPVTAQDFVISYKRALSPLMASEYAYMLYYAVNAEAYFNGEITDFDQVGFKALDDKTLEIRLNNATSFFLTLLNHHSWFPIHPATVAKHGPLFERGSLWTRPGNFVGNGPFVLNEWKVNHVIEVSKNPDYWNADIVTLQKMFFYPYESLDTAERTYRAGQLHKTDKLPLSKIGVYRDAKSPHLYLHPYLGTYVYQLNTRMKGLDDKRVRQALAMAIDREAIVEHVSRGGEASAFHFVPPNTLGYTSQNRVVENIEQARKLLAEAGFPNGQGFPKFSILYNTLESHKSIAEAVQQMWKKNLNIDVGLENQEWKVYLSSKTQGDFDMVRFGWIADYVDPNAFLDLWLSNGGNNNSGWGSEEYDNLIAEANRTLDQEERYEIFQQAEAILMDELPIIPIYFYMNTYLVHPAVQNWNPTILDHHPYQYVKFDTNWSGGLE